MIKTKKDYREYLAKDLERNPMRWYDGLIYNENYHVCKYLKALRRAEYFHNIKRNRFQDILYLLSYLRWKRLSLKYRIKIGLNTCGPGIFLPHIGFIRIATNARIGKNCTIAPGVVVGTKHRYENVATIGDNVELTLGAKIIGKLRIGDNVIVAPNSVVVKDVPSNAIVSGIPAKIIKYKTNGIKRFDI